MLNRMTAEVCLNRRPTRRAVGVLRALATMKNGAALHLHFERGRPIWKLNGIFITAEVVAAVTASPHVVALGDSLFPDHPGQSWRYVND